MCGIIGIIGNTEESFEMLKRNETRGGHAWGIAYNSPFMVYRSPGKVPAVKPDWWPKTSIMIGHTRFATHGKPEINDNNHPHFSKNFCIVHNGVIGNTHPQQRTECDSEAILKMIIERNPQTKEQTIKAIKKIVKKINGSWRIALMNNNTPNMIYVFNDYEPVYWGMGAGSMMFASEEKDLPKNVVRFKAVSNALYTIEIKQDRSIVYDFCKLHVPERYTYYNSTPLDDSQFDWKSYRKNTAVDQWHKQIGTKFGDQCWSCNDVIKDNTACTTCTCDSDCYKCHGDCINCNKHKQEMGGKDLWQPKQRFGHLESQDSEEVKNAISAKQLEKYTSRITTSVIAENAQKKTKNTSRKTGQKHMQMI